MQTNNEWNWGTGGDDDDKDRNLLVHPGLGDEVVVVQVLAEPHGDLLVGRLHAVAAVADVAADINAVVATDGARGGGKGVGLT